MITKKKALVLCAQNLPLLSYANNLDYNNYPDSASSDASRFSAKSLIIPGSLMLNGTVETLLAPKYRMLNYALGHEVAYHQPPKFTVDNITQYIPAASVYILNWSDLKGRHNFKDRTFILGIAGLIAAASVNTLKYTTKIQCPDRSAFNTFPSGHTAVAFMGAEYKHVSP